MSPQTIDKGYEPLEVEKKWYEFWEQEKLFHANSKSDKKHFSIVIPPPNVTGVLHMGHALNNTLQDILCRYHRMKSEEVLWMPGTDHAGIATQNVVEKKLAQEGITRHMLGREKFIERVWEWRKQYGGAIINQLKRLGASCDWDRERFTMDDGLSMAVRQVFVSLYEDGLIYKGHYIINWCPRCHTALADLEVEHEDTQGNLYFIKYPFAEGNGGLIVATTRPETMLGDTAVAVHPEDARYLDVSPYVILPLLNRKLPVIKDNYVDVTFGTGALKVTPAHDPNDFEIGKRHNLDSIKVIDDDGKMTQDAGKYAGLDRTECRKAVIKDLEDQGLMKKIESHQHSVGHCYRCHTIVEPNLSKQWFVKTKPLAEKAIAAVEQGKTKIIPEMWTKTYYDWMNNIRDWCISRQIWWGHRIPAWICKDCDQITVSIQTPTECAHCHKNNIEQETDVLDTWFSSALWPFSTMGWPNQTPELKKFYPTSVLVTGFDILFFWVARMMMMGIHFMKDVPFKDVYVHALVRDEEGKKMSKSKGNVIDPIDVIEKYGTDAFRFTLAAFAAQGRDIRLSEKRIEGYRHFINKLWNASRLSFTHLNDEANQINENPIEISLADKWILSRLNQVCIKVQDALDQYKFNDAAGELYKFVWHEFCDWYLESIKPILYGKEGNKADTLGVLYQVLKNTLLMLHPFIPFVTEDIWHRLPKTKNSIMLQDFPVNIGKHDLETEQAMELLMNIVTSIRTIRSEMNIAPSLSLEVIIHSPDENSRHIIAKHQNSIVNLARLRSVSVTAPSARPNAAATAVVGENIIYISLEGIIDFAQESKRLEKEIEKLDKELVGTNKKLNNEDFLQKAHPDVVEKVKVRSNEISEKLVKLHENLNKVKAFTNK